jgi:predicted nucleic acid-binding protein
MIPRKIVLDTNIYVDWFNKGLREELMLGPGYVRYLSAVVQMELRVGATMLPARRALDQVVRAYRAADRIVAPDTEIFDHAGRVLQRLREAGREIRRASLVNDVLIALSARALGATMVTVDEDYEVIRSIVDFKLERVGAAS